MFVCPNAESADEKVRNWLASNKVIIDHVTQSQSEKNGKFLFIISIFYRQYKESSLEMMSIAAG